MKDGDIVVASGIAGARGIGQWATSREVLFVGARRPVYIEESELRPPSEDTVARVTALEGENARLRIQLRDAMARLERWGAR